MKINCIMALAMLSMAVSSGEEPAVAPEQVQAAVENPAESSSVETLKKEARLGSAKAQYELGMRYLKGDGVRESLLDASMLFQKAEEQGIPNAAEMYKRCQSTLKEIAMAAYAGDAESQYKLGCYSVDTEDIWASTLADGLCWLRDAHKGGISKAKEKMEQTINKLREQADKKDPRALHALGELYYGGSGVEQDYAQALKWYQQAAELGHIQAQCNVGEFYLQGLGVEKDAVVAIKYFRMSAEAGCAMAINNLAACHAHGEGVEKNLEEAAKLYRKAAELGEPLAQGNLGVCYLRGEGVAKDAAEAVKWLSLAAQYGMPFALYYLGNCYDEGTGVPQDKVKAKQLWRQAFEHGYAPALKPLIQAENPPKE